MKVLVAFLFTATFGAASAYRYGYEAKFSLLCLDDESCASDGKFCVGYFPMFGMCKPPTKLGQKCLVNEKRFPLTNIRIVSSPCEEGLTCQPKINKNGKPDNDGTCQLPPPPTTTTATTEGNDEVPEVTDNSGDESGTKVSEQPPTGESQENSAESQENSSESPESSENSSKPPESQESSDENRNSQENSSESSKPQENSNESPNSQENSAESSKPQENDPASPESAEKAE